MAKDHFCPEWDYLLINDSMPEFEACLCILKTEDLKMDDDDEMGQ
jgi:hypothetical protein